MTTRTNPTPQRLTRRHALRLGAGAMALGGFGRRAFAAEDLKIGWVKPMTGPLASSFGPLYIAAEAALEEINAAGGILGRKLVKVEVDDEGSPAKEPIVMQRLGEQGINIVVGPVGSSQAVAALEVSTRRKMIQAAYASADEMGDGNRYPYHYQFNFTSAGQCVRHADYLLALKLNDIGILVEDSAAGASTKDALLKELPKRGLKIVSEQTFPLRTTDMTPFLRKLRSDGAKALDTHLSNNNDITQFMIGLNRIGWTPPIVGHTGLLYSGTPGAIPDAARYNDVYAATYKELTYTDTERPSPRVQAFLKRIIASNVPEGLLGPAATSPFYDFLYALKFAAEKANSVDPDALKAALDASPSLPGLFGNMGFTATRHTAYGSDVVAMAVTNTMEEPMSKEFKGLLRRRGTAA